MLASRKQAHDQLGTPGGAKGFLKGAQIDNRVALLSTIRNTIALNYVRHIFPVVAKPPCSPLCCGPA